MSELRHPVEIDWIVRAAGVEAALQLLDARGGVRVAFPARVTPHCPLAQIVGLTAAEALAREVGGQTIKLPSCKLWRAQVYKARGMSVPKIAVKLGLGESSVWRKLRAAEGSNSRQFTLPL
ncbi:MAG: hypothetical protein E7K72_11810 [Roseomonas mucosa]|nr:hypothetical protein [Roseomonas mucosa]